jgi:non-ribosomal peptide synthetase component F
VTVLLHDLLARAAEGRPGAVALVDGDARLIYSEIATASSRLAATLVRHGVGPGDRVGLLVPTQAEAVVAVHAVLKAGAVYVPLDPGDPAGRLAHIVRGTGTRMLLTVPAAAARLAEAARIVTLPPVGSLTTAPIADLGGRAMSAYTRVEWDTPAPSPSRRGVATDPACLLVTPDGCVVPVTHRMVLSSVGRLPGDLGVGPDDRVSGHAPLHSGLSALDLFGAFAACAELHLVPPTLDRDLRRLVELMRDRELSRWSSAASILTYVARFDALRRGELPALRHVGWTGDPLPPTTLRYWTERVPHARFAPLRDVPGTDVVPIAVTAPPGRPRERERARRASQRHVAFAAPAAPSSAAS